MKATIKAEKTFTFEFNEEEAQILHSLCGRVAGHEHLIAKQLTDKIWNTLQGNVIPVRCFDGTLTAIHPVKG